MLRAEVEGASALIFLDEVHRHMLGDTHVLIRLHVTPA